MKTIVYTRAAARSLVRYKSMAPRIIEKLEAYASGGSSSGSLKRLSTGELRLRVGDYRILFDENESTIVVLVIGPRGNVYS